MSFNPSALQAIRADEQTSKSRTSKGKLVIVGSGIRAVGQFTLEAQGHIQQADIVLYAAADPVTDMWIEKQNPNCFDLYQYYANDKNRIITYTQMIERIMDEVRAGKYVCAIFYGHPGVFVTPSHNAIAIARQEGYEAEMLPAISAEDCLYADLGVDPSIPGLQIFEATDLLLRQRRIDTAMNLILFQVGCVGDVGFKFNGFANSNFHVLVDHLEKVYGPDHEVINYVASMFTMAPTVMATHKIRELRDPAVAASVTGISTFFIRASTVATNDAEIAEKFGLNVGPPRTPLICDRADYPALKQLAQHNNRNHTVPPGYKFSHGSAALYNMFYELAVDVKAQQAYHEDPAGFVNAREGLTAAQRNSLGTRHMGMIRMMFKADPEKEGARFVQDALMRPYLADSYRAQQQVEYAALQRGEIDRSQYQAVLCAWLMKQGYATTPGAVTKAIQAFRLVRADTPAEEAGSAPLAAAE